MCDSLVGPGKTVRAVRTETGLRGSFTRESCASNQQGEHWKNIFIFR